MKINKQQSGFSTVEIILVVLVVVLVGAVGWLAAKNSSKSDDKATPTPSVSATTKASTSPTASASTAATATPKAASSVSISQLGIKLINIPSSLSDLTYTITTSGTSIGAGFSTKALAAIDKDCATNAIGFLSRSSGTYQEGTELSSAFVKQFNGFYIMYSHPQSSCSGNGPVQQQVTSTAAFESLATKAENIVAL